MNVKRFKIHKIRILNLWSDLSLQYVSYYIPQRTMLCFSALSVCLTDCLFVCLSATQQFLNGFW